MADYEIILRDYGKGDEVQISRLFFNNFPDTREPDAICQTWLWQFQNGFSKPSGVSVADLSGEIVAHYAVMWLPMCCRGKSIKGAISTATVTDVKARGKGLFTKLAKKVFKETEADGCKIVFGFPNSQSIHGFIKYLDWFEIATFPLLIKPINFTSFLEKFLKIRWLNVFSGSLMNFAYRVGCCLTDGRGSGKGIRLESIEKEIPDDTADVWKSSFAYGKIAVTRNPDYLKWRYLDKPFSSYEIVRAVDTDDRTAGLMVTAHTEKKGLKVVYVMEMMARDDDKRVYRTFLNQLDRIARERRADAVAMLCLPNNPRKMLFYRNGFIPVPRQMFPQDIHFCARANSGDMNTVYLQDADNWFITWGDLDIV
jgi:hypothetical protein